MDAPEKSYPLTPAKMSKVPSWISVGFLLGLMAGWGLRPEPVPPPPVAPAAMRAPAPPTKLTTIEAVFAQWRTYAIWTEDDHVTEIAFWDFDTHQFSEYYEVRQIGEALYFRSIPQLTRNLVDYGDRLPNECPLRFTAPWKSIPSPRPGIERTAPPPAALQKIAPVKIEPARPGA